MLFKVSATIGSIQASTRTSTTEDTVYSANYGGFRGCVEEIL